MGGYACKHHHAVVIGIIHFVGLLYVFCPVILKNEILTYMKNVSQLLINKLIFFPKKCDIQKEEILYFPIIRKRNPYSCPYPLDIKEMIIFFVNNLVKVIIYNRNGITCNLLDNVVI